MPVGGDVPGVQANDHGLALHQEARRANERRLLVLTGAAATGRSVAADLLEAIPVGIADTVAISEHEDWTCERIAPTHARRVMGRTVSLAVLDLHDGARPNVIGQTTGAVDGGGLLVVLAPDLDGWPDQRDAFDEHLVVAPFELQDVRGQFKRRLVETFRSHPGIGIVDVDTDRLLRSGRTDPTPYRPPPAPSSPPPHHDFPAAAYERSATRDQQRVLASFERLAEGPTAVVVAAPRGRGKSSAAGIAAVCLAHEGAEVAITAPAVENVRSAFAMGASVAEDLDALAARTTGDEPAIDTGPGCVQFYPTEEVPRELARDTIDVLFVDEAAGVPVPLLEQYLECDRLAFVTTLYGYEGAGQGFARRFRTALDRAPHEVIQHEMQTPIRYAASDPIESWLNRALLLDARPPVDEAVEEIAVSDVRYRRWDPGTLAADEHTLREIVGLLATAHYRTEPDDLGRILDAPNLEVATLSSGESIVSVALLAREGNLPPDLRARAYRGERLRGNMLPDIFTNVFRAPEPAAEPGLRIVRIATHRAARRRGLASYLLARIQADLGDEMAWVGTGYGVTPALVRFWAANDYLPLTIGASRNRASGVHSIVMVHRESEGIVERLVPQLVGRLRGSLSDVHRTLDPDVVLAVLEAAPEAPTPSLSADAWRGLVGAADGPGRYDLDPEPARALVIYHLANRETDRLERRAARLLVAKVLQGRSWAHVTESLAYYSRGQARRGLGDALAVLLDLHGGDVVAEERERLAND